MALQVYADEHGIGIFDEDWYDDREPSSCSDLRLDDIKTFLTFTYEILVMAVDKGWFPLDGALMPAEVKE